jgi:uncharacterized protein YndB with AHSA1/START domain
MTTLDVSTDTHLGVDQALLFTLLDRAAGIAKWWGAAPTGMVVRKAQGPDSGVGLVVVFEAGDNLLETWTVKQVEPGQRVVYDVSFAGQFTVERTITLLAEGGGTRVIWRETAELPESTPAMSEQEVAGNFLMALSLLEKAAKS